MTAAEEATRLENVNPCHDSLQLTARDEQGPTKAHGSQVAAIDGVVDGVASYAKKACGFPHRERQPGGSIGRGNGCHHLYYWRDSRSTATD